MTMYFEHDMKRLEGLVRDRIHVHTSLFFMSAFLSLRGKEMFDLSTVNHLSPPEQNIFWLLHYLLLYPDLDESRLLSLENEIPRLRAQLEHQMRLPARSLRLNDSIKTADDDFDV